MTDTRLAELIATRLCHDLTGPIGAVNNGAEFMAEEGADMQGQAIELITSSALEAVARLQFYRMVYGRVPTTGDTSISERLPLIEAFLSGSKIPFHWAVPVDQGGQPHAVFRLLCNLILIASAAMLRKGAIHVETTEQGGQWQLVVRTEGGSVKWESYQQLALDGKADIEALEPKTAQLAFTASLLKQAKGSLEVEADGATLKFIARLAA